MKSFQSMKATAFHLAALLLTLSGLLAVSAAPKAKARAARPGSHVAAPPKQTADTLRSVRELTRYIAQLKKYGRDNHVRVRTDYLEAYLYRLQHLCYPYDTLPGKAFAGALQQRDRLPAANFGYSRTARAASGAALPQRWEFIGPNNLVPPYQIYNGQGNAAGRVNAVAYDPITPSTYWLASATGGAWKSTNSGQTWSFMSSSWPSLQTSSIAVDPSNSNTVYVGTGDYPGDMTGAAALYNTGVMKTTDGGATWTALAKVQFTGLSISRVLVDPETPQTVLAIAGRGRSTFSPTGAVLRSTNGGTAFAAVGGLGSTQANWGGASIGALGTGGKRHYYLAGDGSGAGQIWKSDDRGATWTALTSPLSSNGQLGVDIAASSVDADTVFLMSGTDQKIYKSTDAGATWSNITGSFPADQNAGDGYNWSQNFYDWYIRTSPGKDSTGKAVDFVWVGLIDVVGSFDGGATWKNVGQSYFDTALTHSDQHAFAVNPKNGNEVLVGNDGGIYRATLNGSNVVFANNLNAHLGITQFYNADFDPTNPNRVIGGTQDNGTPAGLGDLTNWRGVIGGDGFGCAINPKNPLIQFGSVYYGAIIRDADGWSTPGTQISDQTTFGNDNVPFAGQVAIDPTNPNFLYAGTNYLWRWNDSSQSWSARLGGQLLATNQNGAGGYLQAIAVAPTDSNTIYTGSNHGEVFMTTNGGTTWTQINGGSPALPNRAILSIAVDPTNPDAVLVGLSGSGSGHVWRCADTTNGSRVWVNISGNAQTTGLPDVPANSVAYDPNDPSHRYYIGMDVGVFRSPDAGVTWENATAPLGLPNVMVTVVKVVPGTGYLMAATYGRGMWRIDPNATVTAEQLTSPAGGETAFVGTPYNITWASTGFPSNNTLRIELSRDGGATYPEVIASAAPDTGSFLWTPTSPAGALCRVRITSLLDTTKSDSSRKNFAIVDGSVTVVYPDGGQILRTGSRVTLKWLSSGFALNSGTVKIELSRDNGATWVTLFGAVNNAVGTQDWTVTGPVTEQALLRVTPTTVPNVAAVSASTFEIRDPTSLAVTFPNGGEVLTAGASTSITWTSAGFLGDVAIDLSEDGGATWAPLFLDVPNTGSVVWTVSSPVTRVGRIRIRSLEEPSVVAQSAGLFQIQNESLSLLAPVAASSFVVGGTASIRWSSTGLSSASQVRIDLSRDGGVNWEPVLGSSVSNSGSADWTVTGPATNSAVIRLTSVESPSITAFTAGTFTVATPSLSVSNPGAGIHWTIGSQVVIGWSGTVVGTGTVTINLSTDGGRHWKPILSKVRNNGGISWGVRGPATKKARLQVVWDQDTSVSATTAGLFRIDAQKKQSKAGH